jgi:predicted nuclease of predicted toxin-antitoxin system
MSRATDVEIINKGRADQRVIVTLDSDFHAHLALSGAQFPSTVRVRIEGLRGDGLAALLIDSWKNIERQLMDGAMVTITDKSIRIRSLPIGENHST